MHPNSPGYPAPPPPDEALKLPELAAASGLPSRTIRYYIQRDLVPAPAFQGRDTLYPHETLLRLKLIKRLQERFMPLERIRQALSGKSRAELEALLAQEDKPDLPGSASSQDARPSAPGDLGMQASPRGVVRLPNAPEAPPAASSGVQPLHPGAPVGSGAGVPASSPAVAAAASGGNAATSGGNAAASALGTPWRRLELLPGLELWIEEGSSQRMQLARELVSYVRARTQAGE